MSHFHKIMPIVPPYQGVSHSIKYVRHQSGAGISKNIHANVAVNAILPIRTGPVLAIILVSYLMIVLDS